MNTKNESQRIEVAERSDMPMCAAHIRYLETMCGLWPIVRARRKAVDAQDYETIKQLNEEQIPILKQAKEHMDEVITWRFRIFSNYNGNEEWRQKMNALCAADPVTWINSFVWTLDPRLLSYQWTDEDDKRVRLSSKIPLIMWPRQEAFVKFVMECAEYKIPWLAEKSRGWGLTWLVSAIYVWYWLYVPGFVGGFGSRVKELVDRWGDPNTIFSKVRFIIYNLPLPMRPEAYRNASFYNPCTQYDNLYRIVNPDNDSSIIGEGGDNIGRGGRTMLYVVDEKAQVEHQDAVDSALSGTTDCQGDVSTVKGMNEFGKKRRDGRARVFTAWWYEDPAKNTNWRDGIRLQKGQNEWLDYQYETQQDHIVKQEVEIDYQAASEGAYIPANWVNAAVDWALEKRDGIDHPVCAGFDVAGAGKNKSVLVIRRGITAMSPIELPYDTPTEAAIDAIHEATMHRVDAFIYDQTAIGEGIKGNFKTTDEGVPFRVIGIVGQASASDTFLYDQGMTANKKYRSKRAEVYGMLRVRFRKTYETRRGIHVWPLSETISIPNDTNLLLQLSQPKKVFTGMREGPESKVELRRRGITDLDHADALAYAFYEEAEGTQVVPDFDYTGKRKHLHPFEINFLEPKEDLYVSLVLSKEPDRMTTYVIAAMWNHSTKAPKLRVFYEFVFENPDPKPIVRQLRFALHEAVKPFKAVLCNKEMYEASQKTIKSPWWLYRKEKLRLVLNHNDDPQAAIMLLNQMFKSDLVEVHSQNCERLWMQLSNWPKGGIPKQKLGLTLALCQIITRLKTKKIIKPRYLSEEFRQARAYARYNYQRRFSQRAKDETPIPNITKYAEESYNALQEKIKRDIPDDLWKKLSAEVED